MPKLPSNKAGVKALTPYEKFLPKAIERGLVRERKFASISIEKLNPEQKKVYDVVESNIKAGIEPLCLLVLGRAGVGKSYLLLALKKLFEKYMVRVEIYSFTGASAYLIGGKPKKYYAPTKLMKIYFRKNVSPWIWTWICLQEQ